jgi:hypothetical protein
MAAVSKGGDVWGLKNDVGLATWKFDEAGGTLVPFWSDEASAKRVGAANFPGYKAFRIKSSDFLGHYLPGMQKQKILVGVQFSADMTGIDMEAADLSRSLKI